MRQRSRVEDLVAPAPEHIGHGSVPISAWVRLVGDPHPLDHAPRPVELPMQCGIGGAGGSHDNTSRGLCHRLAPEPKCPRGPPASAKPSRARTGDRDPLLTSPLQSVSARNRSPLMVLVGLKISGATGSTTCPLRPCRTMMSVVPPASSSTPRHMEDGLSANGSASMPAMGSARPAASIATVFALPRGERCTMDLCIGPARPPPSVSPFSSQLKAAFAVKWEVWQGVQPPREKRRHHSKNGVLDLEHFHLLECAVGPVYVWLEPFDLRDPWPSSFRRGGH